MFNFQGSELVIILLLALVVLGPEKLPEAMRKMGQAYSELRKMSSSFQQEFRSVVDEPMREMRETADLIRDSADFRKLADGERAEKPKSAEMPTVGSPDMVSDADDTEPAEQVPFQSEPTTSADGSIERIEPERPATSPAPPPPFTPSGGLIADDGDTSADGERAE